MNGRLEYLRSQIRAERISYGEIVELQSLTDEIDLSDVELLEWADIIFVMEKRQRNIIHKKYKDIYDRKRIVCMYIPDDYDYMDPDLIQLLKERLPQYVKSSDS